MPATLSIEQIHSALDLSVNTYCSPGWNVPSVLGGDFQNGLLEIERFMKRIEHGRSVSLDEDWTTRPPLGRQISSEFISRHCVSERVRVLLECNEKLVLNAESGWRQPGSRSIVSPNETYGDRMNKFVAMVRARLNDKHVRKRIAARQAGAQEIFNDARAQINRLFRKHESMFVIRLNLGYAGHAFNTDLVDVKRHHTKFLNRIRRKSKFQQLCGYFWKLEYSMIAGYYYHFIFFFKAENGKHPQIDAADIGEYWNRHLAGAGNFEDCALSRIDFIRRGTGLIEQSNKALRSDLVDIGLRYLTESSIFLRVKGVGITRVFGKKELPASTRKAKKIETRAAYPDVEAKLIKPDMPSYVKSREVVAS